MASAQDLDAQQCSPHCREGSLSAVLPLQLCKKLGLLWSLLCLTYLLRFAPGLCSFHPFRFTIVFEVQCQPPALFLPATVVLSFPEDLRFHIHYKGGFLVSTVVPGFPLGSY